MGKTRRSFVIAWAIVGLAELGGARAQAAEEKFAFGVRPVGVSVKPDQYVVGVQAVLGSVGIARFAPGVDIGWGDGVTMTTFNIDAKLRLFSLPNTKAGFYAGLGPTISIISPEVGESDTEIGLSLLGGLRLSFAERHYYILETRFGMGDIPDLKVALGIIFGFGSRDKDTG